MKTFISKVILIGQLRIEYYNSRVVKVTIVVVIVFIIVNKKDS